MSDLETAAAAANDLAEARTLARVMYEILRRQPTSLGDYADCLQTDRLPYWIDGVVRPVEQITEWIAFVGADHPDDAENGWTFEDEDEAQAIARHMVGGRIAVRQLTAGPWAVEAVAADV